MRSFYPRALGTACIVITMLSGTAVNAAANGDATGPGLDRMALPVAYYTSDTGFGVGVAAIASYHAERARISTVQFITIVTTKKQTAIALKWDHYLRRKRDRIGVNTQYAKFPTDFYGIGNKTKNDDPERYTPEYTTFEMFYERVLFRQFSLKTSLNVYNMAIAKGRDGAIAQAPNHRGRLDIGPSLGLVWDSRDNTTATRGGTFLQLEYSGLGYQDRGGSYNELSLDARHFIQPRPWLVLAFQGLYREARGDVPFYLMPNLGGDEHLRGYEQQRYIDRSILLVQHDTRFDIRGPFGGVLFVAAGRAAERMRDLFDGDFHVAYGGGLRYYFNREENMAVRLDYALGDDSSGVYVTFGEAF